MKKNKKLLESAEKLPTGVVVNPCSRCGKERIVVSVEEEIINNSKVITTVMVCPDPDCQKKVDDQLEKEKLKRQQFTENRFTRHKSSVKDK